MPMKDAVRDALITELRTFRRGSGVPAPERLAGLDQLVDCLGLGNAERAFEVLTRLADGHLQTPESDIGAYFYTTGWTIGRATLDQRLERYHDTFSCDRRTGLRRSDRGVVKLATIIRDYAERSRPWAVVSLFQSGNAVQWVLDFHLAYESWRPPTITLDGHAQDLEFQVSPDPHDPGFFWNRTILPEAALNLDVGFSEPMTALRVRWPMPIWPVWQVLSWTADPRLLSRLRTFRERAVETTLEWWRQERPSDGPALLTDHGLWAERGSLATLEAARRLLDL